VLSRGLLSGHWSRDRDLAPGDFRNRATRFAGDNVDRHLALVEALRTVAEAKAATVARVAIAWALSRGDDVVPLVGARRRDRLSEALGALELVSARRTSRGSKSGARRRGGRRSL
jgi:aryl-alcohol dehydrogenase-like predicted oxidoreductase